ncbi:50S ribosomal protein L17 [Verrucomicrobia bacterium]|jgi:large subunit ribosomal protein L17|nr:50S ribosomal protein L17 [Verrucomicrobiota bacterium]
MRHRNKTSKLQRPKAHRRSLLANQACSLIEEGQIKTTLAKAKALRPVVEKLVTLGKKGIAADSAGEKAKGVHYRRQALAFLRQKKSVSKLFNEIATASIDRVGGYTRITKLGPRESDSAPMAYISWVDQFVQATEAEAPVEAEA